MFEKIEKWRCPAYLKHVAQHPCELCGTQDGTIVAHHFGANGKGIATKVDDFYTVPLCSRCHDKIHNGGGGGTWFPGAALDLVGEWLRKKKK